MKHSTLILTGLRALGLAIPTAFSADSSDVLADVALAKSEALAKSASPDGAWIVRLECPFVKEQPDFCSRFRSCTAGRPPIGCCPIGPGSAERQGWSTRHSDGRARASSSFATVDVRREDVDWDFYRRMVDQWRRVAPCMLGDCYPLTDHSLKPDQWIAWQFNRPEAGEGMVQAFRRQDCGEATRVFRLCGLDPTAQYEITNFDVAGATVRRN